MASESYSSDDLDRSSFISESESEDAELEPIKFNPVGRTLKKGKHSNTQKALHTDPE